MSSEQYHQVRYQSYTEHHQGKIKFKKEINQEMNSDAFHT